MVLHLCLCAAENERRRPYLSYFTSGMQPMPLLEIATRAEAGFCTQQTRDSVRLSRAIMCMHHMLVPELCNREFLSRICFIPQKRVWATSLLF